jgi:hypothetical protein
MNNKSFVCIFALILSAQVTIGQTSACGTTPTKKERALYKSTLDFMRSSSQREFEDNTFKVVMYRLRNDDGSGARSDTEFAEEINLLNSYYSQYGVCFSLTRIVNIDNSAFVQLDWFGDYVNSVSMLANSFPAFNDAVTIYVLPTALNPNTKGRAFGIPSGAFSMVSSEGWWGTALSAHEMGHCFGLLHTHETAGGTSFELVTRDLGASCINGQGAWQDCNVGGDALCDTPADFNLNFGVQFVDTTCAYIFDSTIVDCHGNPYNPNPLNIMSYALQTCPNFLSGQQVTKMHLTIDLSGIFNNTQAPPDFNFGDALYSTSYAHFLAKNTITIAPGSAYTVHGDAQIIHDAEGFIDLKPGFTAAPSSVQGLFRARAKNLCDNDTNLPYSMTN